MTLDLKKLYEKQISLTEWFDRIGYPDMEAFRKEDNEKRERLKLLADAIGIPFDAPRQFSATDIAARTPAFEAYLAEHGDELCALRLISLDPALPKLRMRGDTVRGVLTWFAEQKINLAKYKADFVPHAVECRWSTIFVVNDHGIFGEIIPGTHAQLTQGFHADEGPVAFAFDFESWQTSQEAGAALVHLQNIAERLRVTDAVLRESLAKTLDAAFSHEYLSGYFETVASDTFGLWFIDWNRMLGRTYKDFVVTVPNFADQENVVRGMTGAPGRATGVACVITGNEMPSDIPDGAILICRMTTPDAVPLMKKAAAIVTDLGGILTHAAIAAREIAKPCIVGTKIATELFKDGDIIEVDANRGVVRKI